MSETAPVAAPDVAPGLTAAGPKAAAKKPKKAAGASKARKPAGPSVTELITKAVSASKDRKGLSLAAVKKALAAGGYDVEKSNSRIKLGLKSLVSKGTLVQTKGTGASGSFRLSKKPGEVKEKAPKKRAAAAKPKKPAAKKTAVAAKKPKKAVTAKKSPKKVRKPAASAVKKSAKSPKKTVKAAKPKKAAVAAKSPAKAKAVKPKTAKPKAAKPKAAKAKKAAPKKK
ncbi:histone H1.11L-like [Calypte anna]|uniref:histone H1.11L-like n=1 Tax=Calypte anna TaxID=9244 RepID=UPI0011C48512|nr:histone H1.11L-like [Calypte anna]